MEYIVKQLRQVWSHPVADEIKALREQLAVQIRGTQVMAENHEIEVRQLKQKISDLEQQLSECPNEEADYYEELNRGYARDRA